jgi:hypothetical protein
MQQLDIPIITKTYELYRILIFGLRIGRRKRSLSTIESMLLKGIEQLHIG